MVVGAELPDAVGVGVGVAVDCVVRVRGGLPAVPPPRVVVRVDDSAPSPVFDSPSFCVRRAGARLVGGFGGMVVVVVVVGCVESR